MGRIGSWMVVLVLAGGLGVVMEHQLAKAEPADLLRQAKEALALQNYNEAKSSAEQILAGSPSAEVNEQASNILGQAWVGLGGTAEGYKILSELVKRQPTYLKDRETMRRLARAAREAGPPKEAIALQEQAIALFQSSKETAIEIELLHELATFYQNQVHRRENPGDWQAGQLDGSIRAVCVLDRIHDVKGTVDDSIQAYRRQSDLVLQSSHLFLNVGKEKWPSDVPAKYDFSKPFDLAKSFLQEIVRRYPENVGAGQALMQIASIQSNYQQEFVGAVATSREVLNRFGKVPDLRQQSEQMIRSITEPVLNIRTMGVVRPGETLKIEWDSRNIGTIDFEAYAVDLFDALRKDKATYDFMSFLLLMKPTGDPIARWSVDTQDKKDHHYVRGIADAPMKESGAYLLLAKGRGTSEAVQGLGVITQLAMVMKTGQTKTDLFVVDVNSGQPVPKTELLTRRFVRTEQVPLLNVRRMVFDWKEGVVPDSGLASVPNGREVPSGESQSVVALARIGKNYAGSFSQWYHAWWGRQNGEYGYAYTDRPVYRPNQTVQFRALLRQYKDGSFLLPSGKLKVQIVDAKGEKLYDKEHLVTDLGSISGSLTLGEEPALGMYRLEIGYADGRGVSWNPGTQFRVEEYKKPEFEVSIESDKPLVKLGDGMKVKIHGDYYFGGPVADARVSYTVHRQSALPYYPWIRPYAWFYEEQGPRKGGWWPGPQREDLVGQGELKTDANGNAWIDVKTEPFPNDLDRDVQYKIDVQMVDASRREIQSSQTIQVARRAFSISIDPKKHLYQPGDTVKLAVKSQNANNQPVPFEGTRTVLLVTQREVRHDDSGKITTKEETKLLEQEAIRVNERGEGEISFTADEQGYFKIVVETSDPFSPGEKIVGTQYVWVAKAGGAFAHYASRDLEIVLEKGSYRAGETAKILVNCRRPDSYVLLTADGDDLYRSQVVFVKGTQTVVDWPIDPSFRPSIRLYAATVSENKIFEDSVDMRVPPVEQFLTVKIKSAKEEYRPREEATVEVEVVDHEGKPASNVELSLGVFDASVLYIQPETRGDIRKYFHGMERPVSVGGTSSFFFWQGHSFSPRRGRRAMELFDGTLGAGGGVMRMEASNAMPAPASAPMMKSSEGEDKEVAAAPTEVRTDFRDAVFWGPHLKTDSAGRATAAIQFPDSLTRWRLTAIGADAQTRVGEVVHEVRTKKNILVRLEMPRFVVEGDKVVVSAIVHNYLPKAEKVRVDLSEHVGLSLLGVATADWGTGTTRPAAEGTVPVDVPSGGEKRVDFVFVARQVGKVSVVAKALSPSESDAMRIEIPSYEYGAEKLLSESGIIFGNASTREMTASLLIPNAIRTDSQSLVVKISPTVAGVMLESLPYLIQYPYGCVEQTMSRFLPSVLTARTLDELGMKPSDLAKIPVDEQVSKRLKQWHQSPVFSEEEMNRAIRAGVARLADFQHADGGWGWWKQDESSPYMSAYVVSGLSLAREAKVDLPAGMIERGTEYLASIAARVEPVAAYPWMREEDLSLRTYLLYAIGQAQPERLRTPDLNGRLRTIFQKRDGLTDYARALLAVALADANLREESMIVLSNMKDRATLSKETGTASWGRSTGYFYWYDGGTEATSYSLMALLRLEPSSPLIPQAVNWLVRHRQGTRWYNTKDTAIACYALADYLRATGELDPDLTIAVDVNGQEVRRVRVTRENLFTFDDEIKLVAGELGTGNKRISIRTEGRGNCYWGAYGRFFSKEASIDASGSEVFVTRRYEKLVAKKVTKTRTVFRPSDNKNVEESYEAIEYDRIPVADGEKLSSGDLIEVSLDIDARNNFEYVLFEDPKPAGCEPVELQSGYQWGQGVGTHTELRDEKVAFFASYLTQGKHRLSYRLRAEIPGEFHALPAYGECMYTPFVRGNSKSAVIRVVDAQ